jgi:hypothetical protein
MDDVVWFDSDSADRISAAVRLVEGQVKNPGDPSRPNAGAVMSAAVMFVRVTSVTPTAGLYPAKWTLWDSVAQTWTDKDVVKWFDPNGSTPTLNNIYLSRMIGTTTDGTPIYARDISGSGGGGGSATYNSGQGTTYNSGSTNTYNTGSTVTNNTTITNTSTSSVVYQTGSSVTYSTGSTLIQQGIITKPPPTAINLTSSTYNNYTLPTNVSTVIFTSTGPVLMTGLSTTITSNNLTIINQGTYPIQFPHLSSSSLTANQINIPWAGDFFLLPGQSIDLQQGAGAGGGWGLENPGWQSRPTEGVKPTMTLTGDLHDFDPGQYSIIPFDPNGGDYSLTGIVSWIGSAAQFVNVGTSGTLTIQNQNSGSLSQNQITTGTGLGITVKPGQWIGIHKGNGGVTAPLTIAAGTPNATHYSGTTAAAFATVADITDTNGLHGVVNIRNSGITNGAKFKLTFTDMYNNVTTQNVTLAPGIISAFDLDATVSGSSFPPFKEVKVEVQDNVSGSHTTYDTYMALVGH